ncbi:hypothetical protein [Streptomyces mirabilis]|uniref:hypothetical protein n=1 Tax=Streptomyces mirabilis TaxID=68239 RepID=UPI003F4CD3AE
MEYCDSTGITALLAARQRAQAADADMTLAAVPRQHPPHPHRCRPGPGLHHPTRQQYRVGFTSSRRRHGAPCTGEHRTRPHHVRQADLFGCWGAGQHKSRQPTDVAAGIKSGAPTWA